MAAIVADMFWKEMEEEVIGSIAAQTTSLQEGAAHSRDDLRLHSCGRWVDTTDTKSRQKDC